jgi:hypothetical protein
VALEAVLSAYRALDDKTRAHPRNKAIADGVEKRLKSGR